MRRSLMSHSFGNVADVRIPRSVFNRSHGVLTTLDSGYLVPVLVDEILPGDTFTGNLSGFARLSSPLYPLMDNMFMDTFFFFVPKRLVWDNFQKFCGEQVDPGDSIDYTEPTVPVNNASNESIWCYYGIPTQIASNIDVNVCAFRSYNLIWNEWFRDQNLQDSVDVDTDDGPDSMNQYELLRRGKRHDYFTGCLPFLQKGDAVLLSLGTDAPIYGKNMDFDDVKDNQNYAQVMDQLGSSGALRNLLIDAAGVSIEPLYGSSTGDGSGALYADLTEAVGPTVNEFREALAIQRLLEKNARAGTRYAEIIQSHFQVTSPDARLQRPEYLGGGSTPLIVSPVARTDSTAGELSGFGTIQFRNHGFSKSFTEHGYIIGLCCVRADQRYQEGLDKMYSRQTLYDHYWPSTAMLGEQAVLNKEIYIDAATIAAGTDDDVFGYQERWAEYRWKKSTISGKFRSNDAASLDAWHLAIEYGAQPTLDDTFIVENPPLDRCIRTPTEPHFILDAWIDLKCARPLPVYSIPSIIDRF